MSAKGTYDAKGHDEWFGYGKVNTAAAVAEAVRRAGDEEDAATVKAEIACAESSYRTFCSVILREIPPSF